jgi:hypothetical protein
MSVWRTNSWSLSLSLLLRLTISRPVCLETKHPSGAYDQILITVRQLRVCWWGCSLWWEDASVVYNLCWSSPAQSFSGLSPVRLATIFYCLRFKTESLEILHGSLYRLICIHGNLCKIIHCHENVFSGSYASNGNTRYNIVACLATEDAGQIADWFHYRLHQSSRHVIITHN